MTHVVLPLSDSGQLFQCRIHARLQCVIDVSGAGDHIVMMTRKKTFYSSDSDSSQGLMMNQYDISGAEKVFWVRVIANPFTIRFHRLNCPGDGHLLMVSEERGGRSLEFMYSLPEGVNGKEL